MLHLITNSVRWTVSQSWDPKCLPGPQDGVQGIWVHLEREDVLLTRAVQNGDVFAGLLMEEKVKMSFPTEGLQHSKGKTPHCSSCCSPRRVRCNSGQHTQVQLCFQFGKAPLDPIEPFLKQATYQINSCEVFWLQDQEPLFLSVVKCFLIMRRLAGFPFDKIHLFLVCFPSTQSKKPTPGLKQTQF